MRRSPIFSPLVLAGVLAAAAAAQSPPAPDKPAADKPAVDKAAAEKPAATTQAAAPAATKELPIGATAPAFALVGTDDQKHTLAEYLGSGDTAAPATVIVFTCNACPYAKAYEPVLIEMANKYAKSGVRFVAINPNDPKVQPEDSFEKMKDRAKEKAFPFPYLFDATQETAKAYGAARTPHVFMVDSKGVLRYRGRINDHQDPAKAQVQDLAAALDAVLAGKEVATAETKAFGCTIKWKKTS